MSCDVSDVNQRIKSILFYSPKLVVVGLALFNFFYIESHISVTTGGGISFPAFTPWYETSDFSYVLIILGASIFLLVNSRTSYIIAGILSGYLSGLGVIQLLFRKMSLLERWQGIKELELNIYLTIEVQWILAMIVFGITVCYLLGTFLGKKYDSR